jgi:ferredoxin-NADP reductase
LSSTQAAGSIVTLGDVEGEFTLASPTPPKLLFLTAGSGITPVMAMLRSLTRRGEFPDVLHIHSARTQSEAIFASELEALAERHDRYRITQRATSQGGRLQPDSLDEVCPDWRERETYACGPGAMLEALRAHFKTAGVAERLHVESFEHIVRQRFSMRARTPALSYPTAAGWASATPVPARCATVQCAICGPETLPAREQRSAPA